MHSSVEVTACVSSALTRFRMRPTATWSPSRRGYNGTLGVIADAEAVTLEHGDNTSDLPRADGIGQRAIPHVQRKLKAELSGHAQLLHGRDAIGRHVRQIAIVSPWPSRRGILHAIKRGSYCRESRTDGGPYEYSINYRDRSDKHLVAQIISVMQALGGVLYERSTLRFDYPASDIIDDVLNSGILPDERSHQFYPTPASLAQDVIKAADIKAGDRCLEPSAGQGGSAGLMPAAQTQVRRDQRTQLPGIGGAWSSGRAR